MVRLVVDALLDDDVQVNIGPLTHIIDHTAAEQNRRADTAAHG